ncbi:hypothetical protein [Porphyromonas pogonae]|uniref:hypothetical protein n=1 Tax=Porphyromonas pogonae TaxID=867595 RepID=UPI002E7803C5|nr:hypothetical protein [Porphyromonas pogonae]
MFFDNIVFSHFIPEILVILGYITFMLNPFGAKEAKSLQDNQELRIIHLTDHKQTVNRSTGAVCHLFSKVYNRKLPRTKLLYIHFLPKPRIFCPKTIDGFDSDYRLFIFSRPPPFICS